MHTFFQLRLLPLAAATSLLLGACGGGGGGSPAPAAPAVSQASALTVISSTNSTPVAANAYLAGESLTSASSQSTSFVTGVTLDSTTAGAVTTALDLFGLASGTVQNIVTGVTQTQACPGGGSITLSGTRASSTVLSAGDVFTITSSACVINGSTITGALGIALNSLSGTVSATTPWSANLGLTFTNFGATGATESASFDGDMTLAVSQQNSSNATVGLSGTKLHAVTKRNGTVVADKTLSAFSGTAALAGSTVTTTTNYTLTGATPALASFNVTVKTLAPFVRTVGAFPSGGSAIISGTASSVTMTAIDATNVRLDYSAKGDGVITQSTVVTWAALKGAA